MDCIDIPKSIKSTELIQKDYSFSASRYKQIRISNRNAVKLKDLLDRPLKSSDKGVEVGSHSYISESPFRFIRTKGLQPESFLPSFSSESVVPILPSSFKNYDLRKGDILISKDSNIGEVIILDKDYPKHMPSGGIYKLPISNKKLYILGLLKSDFFKTQLNFLVSRGTTIKHAKTLFLDCKIPFPDQENHDEILEHFEKFVSMTIEREEGIRAKNDLINKLIEEELKRQKPGDFQYEYPIFKKITAESRLDVGTYSEEFQKIDFLIKNYANGCFTIDPKKIKAGNTPKQRMIGKTKSLKYLWITPTNITDFGALTDEERITCAHNNLNKNAMLLVNRTSRGGKGEYVGIGLFFDVSLYGEAQHNQGIYRVSGYSDNDLLFMTCFMNANYMRTYCSGLAVGSKMKEIKANHFLSIPFPNFPESQRKQIAKLYMEMILAHEDIKLINQNVANIIEYLIAGKTVEIKHLQLRS